MRLLAIALLMLWPLHAAAKDRDNLGDLHGPAWSGAVEPFRVVGNIYYVGAKNIASYLITTPRGHILIDTGTLEMTSVVSRSVEKLGFKLTDIKIMLSGHAHFDHVGGHAAMKRATGAKVMALAEDAPALASGQDLSPLAAEGWEPVAVDRALKDGEKVSLGGTTMRALLAPGHTPGCTVWTTQTREHGRNFSVLFSACMGPNQQVQLLDNPKFPNLVAQTRTTFRRLLQQKPDIYLSMHPKELFEGKVERIAAGEKPHPLYDPSAWHKLLEQAQEGFEARVQAERAAHARGTPTEDAQQSKGR